MRKGLFVALIAVVGALSVCGGEQKKTELEMPQALREAYKVFVNAMRTGEAGVINKCCLPQSVWFTYEKRKNEADAQNDINTHFAKEGFDDVVATVRKDGEGCYLIRTSTTALWFVETKSMGWKLYAHHDKPIK